MFLALCTSVATKHAPAMSAGAASFSYGEARPGNLDPRTST